MNDSKARLKATIQSNDRIISELTALLLRARSELSDKVLVSDIEMFLSDNDLEKAVN